MWNSLSSTILKLNHRWITKIFPKIGVGTWTLTGKANVCNAHKNIEDLINYHFTKYAPSDHVCRPTMQAALRLLQGRPACILETGSSAWGTNSSLLFSAYVDSFGGTFETVDIRVRPSVELERLCSKNTILYCDDSISFLRKWSMRNKGKKIDLLYLDSWDVDWQNPTPSALHGLAELLCVYSHIGPDTLLLVDDTPVNTEAFNLAQTDLTLFEQYLSAHGFAPGKGALVRQLLTSVGKGREVLHQYQTLWQF
jgi:hypothetical protein